MFKVVEGNIINMSTDAIVNAANNELSFGGGVCGAIFRAAGIEEMTVACNKIKYCKTGKAVITPGFRLKAKYVIHTPGPIWGEVRGNRKELAQCYISSMDLALAHGCKSISFPLISSGLYGCPVEVAYKVAVETIDKYLDKHEELDVYLILYTGKKEICL